MKDEKIISVKLTAFTQIGFLLFALGAAYSASMVIGADVHSEKFVDGATGGLIAVIASLFCFFMGSRKRSFKILHDRVEYWTSKLEFTALYEEIEVLKSYREGGSSEYIAISTFDERLLTVSSAYFASDKLAVVFGELNEKLKDNTNVIIEDDMNWMGK